MDQPRVFDLAVVGAGVSGLILARLLSESSLAAWTVLLIDGARDDDHLRTLSFWASGPTPLDDLVRYRWDTLRLHAGGVPRDLPLTRHTYRTLFLADLHRDVKARLGQRPGNRVAEGRLSALTQDADGATLTVGDAVLRARWVLDSRFQLRDLQVDRRRYHLLRQHFHGWIVRAARDVFDPDAATLLDFRAEVPRGSGFFYVLPFSAREGLVELVTLAPADAEPLLLAYLRRGYGLSAADVELLGRESGISPLTEQPFPWRHGPRVRTLGVAAGRLKPSTGYALTRILDDGAAIVESLERAGHPFAPPRQQAFYRMLDGVLLELWESRPDRIPAAFAAMFLRNPAERVLWFLDERARLRDVARLVLTLPKAPFVVAALRWLSRRLTGHPR